MNLIFLLAFAFLIVLAACTSEPTKSSPEEVKVVTEKVKEHPPNPEAQLSLNNGEKWKANAATKEGIENMQKAVGNYEQDVNQDRDTLQIQLFSKFRTLVEKCTMKGEAHEQLHHYILP